MTTEDQLDQQQDFDIDKYIPFQIVLTEMLMYRVGKPNQAKDVAAVESLSQGESRILTFIYSGKASSPSDLIEHLYIDKALVTRNVNSLVKKGLLAVEQDSQDRRRKNLAVTDKGEKAALALVVRMQDFERHLDTAISAEEKQALMKTLSKLNDLCHTYKIKD